MATPPLLAGSIELLPGVKYPVLRLAITGFGRSDDIGAYPAERPVNPGEVVATIYKALGVDIETHLPGPAARPFPVVDFGVQPVKELF